MADLLNTMLESPALLQAMDKFNKTVEPYHEAKARMLEAEVGVARLLLLGLADKYPEIRVFDFEENSEYDDEGGYFTVVTGYVGWKANGDNASVIDVDAADDEMSEIAHGWLSADILERIGHSVTVAALREAAS